MDPAPINPYQAPQPSVEVPTLERLLGSEPLRFEFTLTDQGIRRALRTTQIRPEIINLRGGCGFLAIVPLAFLTFALLVGGTSLLMLGFTIVIFSMSVFPTLYLMRTLVKAHQHITGPARGWIDATSLHIEQANQTRIMYFDALVSAKHSQDWWALSFEQTRSQMEFLPRSAFTDQGRLEDTITVVDQLMPDTKPQPVDLRRLELPTRPLEFTPGDNAILYSGKLYMEDLVNTEFMSINRRAAKISWFIVLLILIAAIVISVTLGDSFFTALTAVVYVSVFLLLIVRAYLKIRRAKKHSRDDTQDKQIVWCSRGWFDADGIVSSTISGESKTKWAHFTKAEVTDRVIALQSPSPRAWHLFGRDQFENDEQWGNATDLVRNSGLLIES
ncbi:hypothetical protein [Stieleria varia]|uniref:YcxB-like protein domain-containing protein n=1 Tax=Stieleria varia TaxID=2528005 RepID=A0A5C6AER4_9BACT|nr:hypothetical protein [Stieleria varia]TWT98454.1 hypothetical protein Pla52n_49680 [Stieleria varia]